MEEMIRTICRAFALEGDFRGYETIKSGNINNTYCVVFYRDGEEKTYILQRINTYVFKNPYLVMENIAAVTQHIRKKIKETGRSARRNVLHYLYAPDGNSYVIDPTGGFWRGYRYIDRSVTFDTCEDPTVLEQTGRAFGEFQMQLADFDATQIRETIPDFHNTKKRFATFFADVAADPCGRVEEAAETIAYLRSRQAAAVRLIDRLEEGRLPLRVTHNDTKCNNVLFDEETHEALAVIDLDTVMPGLVAYDFGDAVRFAANLAAEDEPDVQKVFFDLSRFEAFARGFLTSCGSLLTQEEIDTMAYGAYAITLEQVVRFLDDYLTGDKYFKTEYPGHNLVRTNCQCALARDIEGKLPQMQQIVHRYAGK